VSRELLTDARESLMRRGDRALHRGVDDLATGPERHPNVPIARGKSILAARREVNPPERAVACAQREEMELATGQERGRVSVRAIAPGRLRLGTLVVRDVDFAVLARGASGRGRGLVGLEHDAGFVQATGDEEKQARQKEEATGSRIHALVIAGERRRSPPENAGTNGPHPGPRAGRYGWSSCNHLPTTPAKTAPAIGATQKSHSCSSAHPPTKSAGPVLRAGLTETLVIGMPMR
jgi:hypothetical protein